MATQELALHLESFRHVDHGAGTPFSACDSSCWGGIGDFGLCGAGDRWLGSEPGVAGRTRMAIAMWTGALLAGGLLPTLRTLAAFQNAELTTDLLMILAATGAVVIGD